MRSVLGDRTAVFDDGGRKLSITKDGISVEGKKPFTLSFSEVGAILPMRYCNSNMLYSLIFRDLQGKNMSLPDLETDTVYQIPKKEFYVLYKLLSNPEKIFTRLDLLDDIWGMEEDLDERLVDACIKRVRQKFKDNPDFDIVTIRGLGYKGTVKNG